jgi:hypothetical protein
MSHYSIQTSLFYSIDYFLNVPIYKKYYAIFSNLDLSGFPNVNTDVGATGFSRHAMLRALIIQTLENIPSIPQLIWFLSNHPVLSDLCGFKHHDLPDETQFYRFLKNIKHSLFEDLLTTVNTILVDLNIIPLREFIIDSRPVLANTKENNHKNPSRNLKDKNRKPKRNRSATLGYYSYQVDKHGNKTNIEFFWGYRNHAIIDAASGICLVEATLPNNRSDIQVAKTLIRKLKKMYKFKKGALFIGDAIYDANDFYHFIIKQMKSKPVIPLNPRNTKNEIKLSKNGHRICPAGLEMYPNGIVTEPKRVRRKERCPIKMSKKVAQKYNNRCPCDHEKFTSGKQYGCTAYIDIAGDLRASVQRDTEQYKKLRAKRMAIERYFSRLQMLDMEDTPYYNSRSIKNRNTITHLSVSLVALAAVKLGRKQDMHRYRRFAA